MKTLTASFFIPKNYVKNANKSLAPIVAARKSSWIRTHSEPTWAAAVKEQFGIVAKEPDKNCLKHFNISEESQKILDDIEKREKEFADLVKEEKRLQSMKSEISSDRKLLRKLSKDKGVEYFALEDEIFAYEKQVQQVKSAKERIRKVISNLKNNQKPSVDKELRKIEKNRKDDYRTKKIAANSHIFETCAVIVRSHIITSSKFDAPNFYPTVKPIIDAATDTGVIWEDDNNSIISGGFLFLPGKVKDRNNYVFDITITDEWGWET